MPLESAEHVPDVLGLLDAAHYSFSLGALPYFFTSLGVAFAGLLILFWERGTRISYLFAGTSALFTAWAFLRGGIRMAEDPGVIVMLMRYDYALVCLAVALLVEFIFVMFRTDARRRLLIRANWIAAAVLAFISVETPWAVAGVHHYDWGMEPANGPAGLAIVMWMGALSALVLIDGYRAWKAALEDTEERRRTRWFIVATVALLLTIPEFLTFSGIPIYPLGFLSVLIFNWMSAYITWRFGLVEVTEELAAHQIGSLTRGALLLLDSDGVIRGGNRRTEQILGIRVGQVLGRRAHKVLGEAFALDQLASLAGVQDADAEKVVMYRLPPKGDLRDLALAVAAVRDRRGRAVAYACSLRDMTDQRALPDESATDDLKDTLTGLPNRTMFLTLVDAAAARAKKNPEHTYAVLIVGVDRLRRINEDLGFAAGDQVLSHVASRLQLVVTPQDVISRVSGDEFGILMRRYQVQDEVSALASEICRAVDLPIVIGTNQLYVNARIGVVTSQVGPSDGEQVLRNASVAMFRAKEKLTNVYFLTAGDGVQQRIRIESDLRRALHRGELRVFYEPVVDTAAQRAIGFEALVRWQHPEKGLLLPGSFIGVAADMGLMAELDRYVLRQAVLDLARLQRKLGDTRYSVNVNLSEETLRSPDLVHLVDQVLEETGIPPPSLHIELLEHVAQVEPVHATLKALQARGVELYLDDFGTGYSSMGRLSEIPARGIKIDRSLVQAMNRDEGGAKVIAGIIAFAHSLGLDVVAEGCSARLEISRLQQLGCRKFQGFYFTRSASLDQLISLLMPGGAMEQRLEQLRSGTGSDDSA